MESWKVPKVGTEEVTSRKKSDCESPLSWLVVGEAGRREVTATERECSRAPNFAAISGAARLTVLAAARKVEQ